MKRIKVVYVTEDGPQFETRQWMNMVQLEQQWLGFGLSERHGSCAARDAVVAGTIDAWEFSDPIRYMPPSQGPFSH